MSNGPPLHDRLLRRFRARSVRDLRDLDTRGRLGEPPRPFSLAISVAVLIALLGGTTFALGRSEGIPLVLLLVAAIGVFGLAVAVGSALAVAEYRTVQEADRAQAELLTLHAELNLARAEAAARLHDARALTAAMDAALHALSQSGADRATVAALGEQVAQLRGLLASAPTPRLVPVAAGEALAEVGSFAALHGVTLLHEASDDAVVLADREHLAAILRNLVDNARKYAPGSPVLVAFEDAGPCLRIVLEDRGPGISPTDAEALFLPGVRHGGAARGSGLGLAIARDLAAGMQGGLWYEPAAGRGSRFVLQLPRPGRETADPTEAP